VFPETSHRTMSDLTRPLSDLQFEFPETSSRTMSINFRQCPTDSFSLMFVHYFWPNLITECPFDHILLSLAS
jgi:hypothetical protein